MYVPPLAPLNFCDNWLYCTFDTVTVPVELIVTSPSLAPQAVPAPKRTHAVWNSALGMSNEKNEVAAPVAELEDIRVDDKPASGVRTED